MRGPTILGVSARGVATSALALLLVAGLPWADLRAGPEQAARDAMVAYFEALGRSDVAGAVAALHPDEREGVRLRDYFRAHAPALVGVGVGRRLGETPEIRQVRPDGAGYVVVARQPAAGDRTLRFVLERTRRILKDSGFTRGTYPLAELEPAAAEQLGQALQAAFDQLAGRVPADRIGADMSVTTVEYRLRPAGDSLALVPGVARETERRRDVAALAREADDRLYKEFDVEGALTLVRQALEQAPDNAGLQRSLERLQKVRAATEGLEWRVETDGRRRLLHIRNTSGQAIFTLGVEMVIKDADGNVTQRNKAQLGSMFCQPGSGIPPGYEGRCRLMGGGRGADVEHRVLVAFPKR